MTKIAANILTKVFLFIGLFSFGSAYAIDSSRPDKLIADLIGNVLIQLEQEIPALKKNPDRVYSFANRVVNKTIMPHYDLARMSAYIVGKPWRSAKKREKLSFMREFKKMIIRTYAKSLLEYSGQKIKVLPHRPTGKKNAVVKAKFIFNDGQPPVAVSFRLHKSKSKGWRVFDITVAGASQIKAYQGSLRSSIQQGGINGAIKAMKKKGKEK